MPINKGYVRRLKVARFTLLQLLKDKSQNNKRPSEELIRASGNCICEICNEEYYSHFYDPELEFLNVRCDGQRLKL